MYDMIRRRGLYSRSLYVLSTLAEMQYIYPLNDLVLTSNVWLILD